MLWKSEVKFGSVKLHQKNKPPPISLQKVINNSSLLRLIR